MNVLRRGRAALRTFAGRHGGLPHATDEVDRPTPEAARDITRLWLRNSFPLGAPRMTDPAGPAVVCMTTHGERLSTVWVALEAIARGAVLPARLILWLDRGVTLPRRLRRLQRRGLEIRWSDSSLRSYKKFWPYLADGRDPLPLVVVDDDVVYPPTWLEGLIRVHAEHPDDVIAYRAHRITVDEAGNVRPYTQWLSCDDDLPSFAHFATGVSGVLYPEVLQDELRAEGEAFREIAPTADDVWLHRAAVLHGHRTRQVLPGQQHWPFVPGTQSIGLNLVNVVGGGNDLQMEAAHTDLTRRRIREDIAKISSLQ